MQQLVYATGGANFDGPPVDDPRQRGGIPRDGQQKAAVGRGLTKGDSTVLLNRFVVAERVKRQRTVSIFRHIPSPAAGYCLRSRDGQRKHSRLRCVKLINQHGHVGLPNNDPLPPAGSIRLRIGSIRFQDRQGSVLKEPLPGARNWPAEEAGQFVKCYRDIRRWFAHLVRSHCSTCSSAWRIASGSLSARASNSRWRPGFSG